MLKHKEGVETYNYKQVPVMSTITSGSKSRVRSKNKLSEGWALFLSRLRVALTVTQRSYLENKYDKGEKSGAK